MKKDLTWRLSELPDATDVARLVEQMVITVDEAREILFRERTNDDKSDRYVEVKSLKEQIKFQQDTIDKLISKLGKVQFTNTYIPRYPTSYWVSSGTTGSGMLTTTNQSASFTVNSIK